MLQHVHRGQRTAYRRQFIPSFSHAVPKGLRSSHSVTSAFTPWHHLTSSSGNFLKNLFYFIKLLEFFTKSGFSA